MNENLIAHTSPCALPANVQTVGGVRFTVLTDRLIRVETGNHTDEATQCVWFRDMPPVEYDLTKTRGGIQIRTATTLFRFSSGGKFRYATLSDGRDARDSRTNNLKGTMRTLDQKGAHVRLGNGVISRSGVAILDDSRSLILTQEGTFASRPACTDQYIFAYGTDYRGALSAFYAITGPVPMLPRGVLGNWWSRYHQYTQNEYLDLMQNFRRHDVPLTVATVDMDWHWVDVKLRFGDKKDGWTGYSWNTELFPDYRAFLSELRSQGLMVTLNLHPADGIRWFEDMYPAVARRMGIDPESKETVPFDLSNDDFINCYFEELHRPYEREGVNFWWIDWQQGTKSTVKGLDPLWALNHYHYLDNSALGNRPLILSRFGGPGSHRYPLGFSGDTLTTWGALSIQPYVTATAANIGYTWWSHDIGGHMLGYRDEELYLRWIQLGVFSPINRLHSTAEEYVYKEPWAFTPATERIASDYLRLRHRLIPYIYSMSEKTHSQGIAICEPLYYTYRHDNKAYFFTNQYMFGSELMVSPMVKHTSSKTRYATVETWFPEGRWTDIFTGQIYEGNCVLPVNRDVSAYPVFAKAGAIIPLSAEPGNSIANPAAFDIWAYRGSGNFTLYEDGNDAHGYTRGASCTTKYLISESQQISFCVSPAAGDLSVIPAERTYTVYFKDVVSGDVTATVNGETIEVFAQMSEGCVSVHLPPVAVTDTIEITIKDHTVAQNKNYFDALTEALGHWEHINAAKMIIFSKFYSINALQYLLNGRNRKPLKKVSKQKALRMISRRWRTPLLRVPTALRDLWKEVVSIAPDENN